MNYRKHASKIIIASITAGAIFMTPFGEANQASASSGSAVVQQANKLKGVKYRYGGTTTSGFDCSGFVQYAFKKAGKSLPRTTSGMYRTGKSVSYSSLRAGDLVFFNTSGRGVSHVGIYVGNGNFIHSSSSKGVSVAKVKGAYWGARYIGAKRVL